MSDGVQFEGSRLRVEMSRQSGGDRGGGGGGYGGRDDRGPPRRDYDDRGPPPRRAAPRDLRRSEHRVIISGLPTSASWQDLKDFFRQAGDVIFTDVDRHGGGIVEFANKSDQEYAISKLDDTEFKSEYRNQGDKVSLREGPGLRSHAAPRASTRYFVQWSARQAPAREAGENPSLPQREPISPAHTHALTRVGTAG